MKKLIVLCFAFPLLVSAAPAPSCQASPADQAWVNGLVGRVMANDALARAVGARAGGWMLCQGQVSGNEAGVTLGGFRALWSGGLELKLTKWSAEGSDLDLRAPGGTLDNLQILELASAAFEGSNTPITLPSPFQPQPKGWVEVDSEDSDAPGFVRIEHDTAGRITRLLWRIGNREAQ